MSRSRQKWFVIIQFLRINQPSERLRQTDLGESDVFFSPILSDLSFFFWFINDNHIMVEEEE